MKRATLTLDGEGEVTFSLMDDGYLEIEVFQQCSLKETVAPDEVRRLIAWLASHNDMNRRKKMKKYLYHCDSRHGWLAVPRKELKALGLLAKITCFSYQTPTGKTVYLEEDLDAQLFLREVDRDSIVVEERHTNKPSRIRRLPQFKLNEGE